MPFTPFGPPGSSSSVYNVTPSGDTSGATDPVKINAQLQANGLAVLGPFTYYLASTIELPGYAALLGYGYDAPNGGTILQQVAGANLNAVIASQGWLESTNTTSVSPGRLENLRITGQPAQGSGAGHGIVLQTFRSLVRNCAVSGVLGDGIRFDEKGLNGTTQIGNSAVENRVDKCAFRSCGAIGIHTSDPTANVFTDGFVNDCIVQAPGSHGMLIRKAAGWKISGNHLYSLPASGIICNSAFETRITGNYVEPWGQSATAGTYRGIDFASIPLSDGGNGSVVADNDIHQTQAPGNATSTIRGIDVTAATGFTGTITIVGNHLFCAQNTGATSYDAISLANQSATATLIAVTTGNNATGLWVNTLLLNANGGTLTHTAGI